MTAFRKLAKVLGFLAAGKTNDSFTRAGCRNPPLQRQTETLSQGPLRCYDRLLRIQGHSRAVHPPIYPPRPRCQHHIAVDMSRGYARYFYPRTTPRRSLPLRTSIQSKNMGVPEEKIGTASRPLNK